MYEKDLEIERLTMELEAASELKDDYYEEVRRIHHQIAAIEASRRFNEKILHERKMRMLRNGQQLTAI